MMKWDLLNSGGGLLWNLLCIALIVGAVWGFILDRIEKYGAL